MSVARVNETLDLIEASDEEMATASLRPARNHTDARERDLAPPVSSSARRSQAPLNGRAGINTSGAHYCRPRTLALYGSAIQLPSDPRIDVAADRVAKARAGVGHESQRLGHELGYASTLWDARDRLIADPARTLALNRASSGVDEYVDRQFRAKLGATTVRVPPRRAWGSSERDAKQND